MSKERLGEICVLLSAVLFGTMPLLAKVAYTGGANAFEVAFARAFFGAIFSLIVHLVVPGMSVKVSYHQLWQLLRLGLIFASAPLLLYNSYVYLSSGLATTLHFTYPVIVMVLLAVFFRKKINKKHIVCAVLCTAGIILLYQPTDGEEAIGMLLAFVSGVAYAFYIIYLGRSDLEGMHPLTSTFWVSLFASAGLFVCSLVMGKMNFTITPMALAGEIALGLFCTLIAVALFQKGVQVCGEVKASLLSTFEPITSLIVGILWFQEVMTLRSSAAVVLILISTVLLVLWDKKEQV